MKGKVRRLPASTARYLSISTLYHKNKTCNRIKRDPDHRLCTKKRRPPHARRGTRRTASRTTQRPKTRQSADDLLREVRLKAEERAEVQPLAGITFVITGSVEHFANRSELKAKIEELGGKVTGSVTGKTGYLINNEPSSGSSKNRKAAELKIPVISEEEFLEMINERTGG